MSIYLKTRNENGKVITKERKLVKYFENDQDWSKFEKEHNITLNGNYVNVPEEKPVKENAVPKARAEYVSINTRSNNNRTDSIEFNGEIYKIPHLITTEEKESLKRSEKLIKDMRKASQLFFSEPFTKIDAMIFKMSKEGEDVERKTFDIHEFNNYVAKMLFEDSLESYRELKKFHVFDPRQNNNYCIIDHVNSISGKKYKDEYGKLKDELLGQLYDAAYTAAKNDHFNYEQIYTMKKFCKALNNSKNPSKQYKTWVRQNFYPKKVYLICDNITNYDAKYAYKLWTDKKVDVMVIQAEQLMRNYKYHNKNTIEEKIANTWANAVGWSFEAPIYRLPTENNIDMYSAGNLSKRQELITRGVKVSKITTRSDKFIKFNRALASDDETKDMARNVIWKNKVGILNKKYIDIENEDTCGPRFAIPKTRTTYMLEMDQTVCECCGRPRYILNTKDKYQNQTDKTICPYCETEFDDLEGVYELNTYYDDSYRDEFDDYLDDIVSSTDAYDTEDLIEE